MQHSSALPVRLSEESLDQNNDAAALPGLSGLTWWLRMNDRLVSDVAFAGIDVPLSSFRLR